ncbi:Lipopolysaccharide export system ATP-binding protein LptB [Roseivivax jejudonensis]|uniref:Lipopolysaccharide export system ATP-binding protein LptB n=1 Tax=Roseivivax jejudonensis TaxID=1529041 RepID=A0A1X6ZJR8_9RHOB|nr:ABC transporter ATP-binding protein [Roseivivax jejudonensis]SLN53244.1 Lipopolysaccharide export system ATP-binding protein LptB [Roseivivax jejudonensis]
MTALLDIRGLSRHFGALRAVDDVSFAVARGEIVALIGPNGAGKSTCFSMLMGELRPTGGQILLDGQDITRWPTRRIWRAGVGRTFQITATYPSMRVVENVQVALMSHHRRSFALVPRARGLYRDRAMELLATVGMAEQAARPAAVLAYGDLKRLDLAMALAHDPRLLLMDEPTAGMAPAERAALMTLVSDIARDRGTAILFTEHDMDAVFAHAERILVLDRGRLIAEGPPAAIQADRSVQEVYLGSALEDAAPAAAQREETP